MSSLRPPGLSTLLMACAMLQTSLGASAPAGAEIPTQKAVDSGRLVANLHLPAGEGPFPGIVLIGGSGGGIGWQDQIGALLAAEGYVALALAYFGMEGLPEHLERIPLEYFDEAIDHLSAVDRVDPERLGVVGVSKGGELALLLAARNPSLRTVVAFVPSSVVFQSIPPAWPRTSSWSEEGQDVPFVPYLISENFRRDHLAIMYRESLDQEGTEGAVIRVENIRGPILLLSGKADTLWPSEYMSEQVIARLESNEFPHEYEHVPYEDAGHVISRVTEETTRLGGTAAGNRAAQEDAQRRMLEFLARHLQPPRP